MSGSRKSTWGSASAFLREVRHAGWIDLALVAGLAGLVLGLAGIARDWGHALQPAVDIDLSPWALPGYTLLSLSRGVMAYVLSLAFSLVYGFWAAKDRRAERLLVPLLDVLQSVPVLGFMPGLVLTLVALFPRTNVGLELAAVVMIFTGQAWNMTFSFYQSLRGVPPDLEDAATAYGFDWKRRFRRVELPFATTGLVWNSMMSMAGGWFFLMISESFVLGTHDFRLPGVGSYMSVAVARGDMGAMVAAVLAMTVMIVALDQLFWRPVVAWAQRFRVEEGGAAPVATSWVLDRLRASRLLAWVEARARARRAPRASRPAPPPPQRRGPRGDLPASARAVSTVLLAALAVALAVGAWGLWGALRPVPASTWASTLGSAGITLVRVLAATALATLWALPAGVAIGLSPRLSRVLQPVVQIAASFPAPMLFPLVVAGLAALHVSLDWGSVFLMLMGTQWYVLFNVVAGAMAIPADLREAARGYRFGPVRRFRRVYAPAVFPYLVTGWITAAGGAWNASIVSEYVTSRGAVLQAHGLGAQISAAAEGGDLPLLAASVTVMSTVVVLFNRFVWRRLFRVAESRFALGQ